MTSNNSFPGLSLTLGIGVSLGFGLGLLLKKYKLSKRFSLAHHAPARKFKLHLYDHCPFCIRVELVMGLRNIPYERVLWGYGDIDGPTKKFGKKMLPVLEYTNDEGEEVILKESLDIISFIEKLDGEENAVFAPSTGRFSDWINTCYKPSLRLLSRPRIVNVPIFDWAKPEDVAYAKNKYTKQGYDYDKALASTDKAIKEANLALKNLETMMFCSDHVNSWGLSMDDILLLPELRTLTCVKGVEWPPLVLKYLKTVCGKANVALYFEHAQD